MVKKIISRLRKLSLSFWLIVFIPTAFSAIYYGFIASDRYVSTSSFVVRSPQKAASVSGLSALLQNVGFSRSTDDSYVVNDFVLSRDAMNGLDKELNLREKFSGRHADVLSRFDPFGFNTSSENLYEYYKGKVNIVLDVPSSISTLTVRAYTAEDARVMNEKLLVMAEGMVNHLNERGRQDMMLMAEDTVLKAEERVQEVSTQLMHYRTSNQIFDVDKEAQLQMQLISKLQDQHILVKTQLAQVMAVTPENPQIRVLVQREKTIQSEIAKETAKALGGQGSLNQKAVEYEKLLLEKEFATKQLASALAMQEQNKAEASKKQLYLERVTQPSLPDYATEPERLKKILSFFLFGMIIWGIVELILAGIKEHQS